MAAVAAGRDLRDVSALTDYFETVRLLEAEDFDEAHRHNRTIKRLSGKYAAEQHSAQMLELNKRSLLFDAPYDFDSYLRYLEWDRPPEKKFYIPRRSVLKPLVGDLQDLADNKLDFLGISLPPRVGKAVALDTPVLTRNGWKEHGDLTIRDEVIAPNGRFVRVIAIHPVCEMEYKVTFTNGEMVYCHGNHEWTIFNRHKQKEETLETWRMLSDFQSDGEGRGHRYFYMLPDREAIIGEEKDLPIAPYTLGVWLGDGRNQSPDICGAESDCEIIVENIYAEGYPFAWKTKHKTTGVFYYGFKNLRQALQSEGMCHSKHKTEKHIPETYFTASVQQRLDLLAGLIDTDGSLRRGENRYSFSTAEERLRDDVIKLVSTFGWRCNVVEYKPRISTSGVHGKRSCWVVSFNPTMYIPCRLQRKQLHKFSKQRRVAIKSIEKCNCGIPGNCITVEGGMYCIGNRMIPTHNSTLGIFFMTWIMGRNPDSASVMSGHSDKLTDGFYRELLSILTDPETYLWADVFPGMKMVDNSAKNETIDLGHKKRFPTMTCRSIGGTLTGAVEIGPGGVLYCDDLIEDLEESLNPLRLQAKYDAYLNQLKDRKKLGALELMVGTRWNVLDPLGRVHEQYADNPRYRFRVIPALNDDGESNFNYRYGLGFDTAYYLDMKDSIDDATWNAKYQGRPYIREGLLFPEDELLTYNGVLPDGEPERLAVCDVAWGGGDSLAMPIAYRFGDEVYIHDVIFNQGDKTATYPVVIGRTKQHLLHRARFEANNGGAEYADHVDDELRKAGYRVNITTRKAPSNQSKLARIIQFAPDIKKFYFLDDRHRNREYRAFMQELTTFVQTGKNLHDDAPDSLAMLADELYHGGTRIEVFKRPF